VPDSESRRGEVGALLTSTTLLVWLPVAPGVKLTENFAVCPGVSVKGTLGPVMPKPVPGPVSCVISRAALPELLTVIVWLLVTPNDTLPKLMLPGAIEIAGCTPVPARDT